MSAELHECDQCGAKIPCGWHWVKHLVLNHLDSEIGQFAADNFWRNYHNRWWNQHQFTSDPEYGEVLARSFARHLAEAS